MSEAKKLRKQKLRHILSQKKLKNLSQNSKWIIVYSSFEWTSQGGEMEIRKLTDEQWSFVEPLLFTKGGFRKAK